MIDFKCCFTKFISTDRRILSCGILETPRFGRKSNFFFVPGSSVAFECNEGFVLIGDARRTCTSEGQWDPPVYGYTTCLRKYKKKKRNFCPAISIFALHIHNGFLMLKIVFFRRRGLLFASGCLDLNRHYYRGHSANHNVCCLRGLLLS